MLPFFATACKRLHCPANLLGQKFRCTERGMQACLALHARSPYHLRVTKLHSTAMTRPTQASRLLTCQVRMPCLLSEGLNIQSSVTGSVRPGVSRCWRNSQLTGAGSYPHTSEKPWGATGQQASLTQELHFAFSQYTLRGQLTHAPAPLSNS